MNLTKDEWKEEDIRLFSEYLSSLSKSEEKALWEQRIVNTPMPCIAVPSREVDNIARQIAKGNYKEYLDIMPWDNLTETLISGKVINRIKDIEEYLYYLEKYINRCDNWASTDILKFPTKQEFRPILLTKAKEYISSDKPFVRRVGLLILMKNFLIDEYIEEVLNTLNILVSETEYYVLMMMAWLLCESVIKCKDKTMKYIKECNLCDFAINKAISKCMDSFRISAEDKAVLKTYRRKNIRVVKFNYVEFVPPLKRKK